MCIELMTIKDYSELYRIWTTTPGMGLRSLDDSEAGIDRFLKRNPTTNFVCRIENEIVGAILCGHDGRRGYIYHAVVKESHRNRGIGKELVTHVLEALDREGIKKAALVVYADNVLGNRFWETLGFTDRKDLTYRNRAIDERNT